MKKDCGNEEIECKREVRKVIKNGAQAKIKIKEIKHMRKHCDIVAAGKETSL